MGKLMTLQLLKLFIAVVVLIACQPMKKWQTVENQIKLHSWTPRTLYRDFYTWPELSPDGSQIAYIREGQLKVLDFPYDQEKDISSSFGFDRVKRFNWQGNGAQIEITGTKARRDLNEHVTFKPDVEINIPVSSKEIVWSKDGKSIAYYLEGDQQKGIWIAEEDNSNAILAIPDMYPYYLTFSNNGSLLAVISEDTGRSNKLTLYNIHEKKYALLIESLDAIDPVYFTPGDESILFSMVSDKPFDGKNIHKPIADRDLDIFSFNIKNKSMKKVIGGEGEDVIIGIKKNKIYWTTIKSTLGIGLVSLSDGRIEEIISENAFLPCWHPEGNKISTSYGQFRLMDFPMNWDIASIEIDSQMQVVGELYPEVTGYHEDMFPMWSPDGKMLAYHSHRSSTPVTSYRAPGSTDAIWIWDSESGSEHMLANPGVEVAMCDWSPDGRKIVFTTVAEDDDKHAPWIVEYSNKKEPPGTVSRVSPGELDGDVLAVVWSPLGNEIAFEEDLGGFKRVIWVVNLNNKTKRSIVEYTCFARWGGLDFSNDGKSIYYSALTKGHHQIFKISLDGKYKVQITNHDREVIYPQVSPDGDFIACSVYEHKKEIWSAVLK